MPDSDFVGLCTHFFFVSRIISVHGALYVMIFGRSRVGLHFVVRIFE
jgi:hypothetical protein